MIQKIGPFKQQVKSDLQSFIDRNALVFNEKDVLKIDLHCHDHNSNVPDEILGRILNVPETWLPTKKLLATLNKHGMDAYTITNHNNGRSCFDLLDKGIDILVGGEFTCMVPDFQVGIHVLTYGFNPIQETQLNRHRKNLYAFLDYTLENNLPTIWAHPLYHYKKDGSPSMEFFKKMALVFERFEVLNGQRDSWQNMLVKCWIESLTEERISKISLETGLDPGRFCKDPFQKHMAAGSDSHMGIFSGLTGVYLHVPDLSEKRKTLPLSSLALDAIRNNQMAAFGGHNNTEKMMITLLDYVSQIALHSKDPGLMRILLHKGESKQKITALLVANGFSELRQHKVTMSFIKVFHDSLTGIKPHFAKRWLLAKAYKPIFDKAGEMAKVYKTNPVDAVESYSQSIGEIYGMLSDILDKRLSHKIESMKKKGHDNDLDLNNIISRFELPAILRSYLGDQEGKPSKAAGFLDGLSFPFLTSAVILSAHFTSARVMYNKRPMLNEFSKGLGYLEHPKKMLWLTDTWNDRNGVSIFLKSFLLEIQARNLPIDIMICSDTVPEENHLVVVRSQSELDIPFYQDQKIRIPNLLDIHHKFLEGEYDRVMCSTEGAMGLAALYLKSAYTVPAYFYVHSDWKTFTKQVLGFNKENQNRFIRLIRAFYKEFDGVFVLNSDHLKWLTNKKMALDKSAVFQTAHWPGNHFKPMKSSKTRLFGFDEKSPVVLFAGRLSQEKGVMDLPGIYLAIKKKIPNIRMVVAGSGPAEKALKKIMPDATYLGWMDPSALPEIYSSADILLLPSSFDTFSCVVVEAMSCGLPVIAFNSKGPKDIIGNGVNGYLVSDKEAMIERVLEYLNNPSGNSEMAAAALKRSKDFKAGPIILNLLNKTGLNSQVANPI